MFNGAGTLLFDDDFAYADGSVLTTIAPTKWNNGFWNGQPSCEVTGGKAYTPTLAWHDSYTDDNFSVGANGLEFVLNNVTIPTDGTWAYFHMLGKTQGEAGAGHSPSMYYLRFRSAQLVAFGRCDDGVYTDSITAPSPTATNGDSYAVQFLADGHVVMYRKPSGGSWSAVGQCIVDTTYTSGHLSIEVYGTAARYDSVEIREAGPPLAPYIFQGATLIASVDASAPYTVTPTLPAHKSGDILVVAAAYNAGSNLTCATSGWAEIIAAENNANFSTAWFWKRATSAAETAPVITSSATGGTNLGIYATAYCIRGAITTGTPFEAAALSTLATTTTPPVPAITTLGPNRLCVSIAQCDDDPVATSNWPAAGAITVGTFGTQGSTTGGDYRIFTQSKDQASAGAVATYNAATIAARYHKVLHLAFIPEPSGPDTTPPVPNITVGPSKTRISSVTSFDSTDITVQVDEACQAWKAKVVPATSSIESAGTVIESGGAVAAGGTINVTITDDELVAASAGEGAKIVKFFFQDTAGNWSI